MKVLITGGAGYIGSHTAKLFAGAGLQPIVLDNLKRGSRQAVQWGPLVEVDLADCDALRKVFTEYEIEAVIHFGAYCYVGESMQAPGLYFRNNVVNTLNLLDVMREKQVRKIVFSSTCATYGNPLRIPIDRKSTRLN